MNEAEWSLWKQSSIRGVWIKVLTAKSDLDGISEGLVSCAEGKGVWITKLLTLGVPGVATNGGFLLYPMQPSTQ